MAQNFWCGCFVLSAIIYCVLSAPPLRTQGNPHPFYESPYPVETGDIERPDLDLDEPLDLNILKRNPAPPEDCTACCGDFWCSYINDRCLCSPRWNIGP